MTHQIESSIIEELLKVLSLREPNGLRNTLQVLLNAAMKAEQEQVLKADHYERRMNGKHTGTGTRTRLSRHGWAR